jgi:hypothetical protein
VFILWSRVTSHLNPLFLFFNRLIGRIHCIKRRKKKLFFLRLSNERTDKYTHKQVLLDSTQPFLIYHRLLVMYDYNEERPIILKQSLRRERKREKESHLITPNYLSIKSLKNKAYLICCCTDM